MTTPNPTDLRQAVARIVDSEAMRTLEEWGAIDKRLPVVLPPKVTPWPQARFSAYASSREAALAKADAIHALYTARINALTAEPDSLRDMLHAAYLAGLQEMARYAGLPTDDLDESASDYATSAVAAFLRTRRGEAG